MWSLTVLKDNLRQVLYFTDLEILNATQNLLEENGYECISMYEGHPVCDPHDALEFIENGLNEFLYGENV